MQGRLSLSKNYRLSLSMKEQHICVFGVRYLYAGNLILYQIISLNQTLRFLSLNIFHKLWVCSLYIFAYPYFIRIVAVFIHLAVVIQIIRYLDNDIV